jgi:SOS-response transcriptional repressor LexA
MNKPVKGLTPMQKKTKEAITSLSKVGYAPSIKELALHLKLSSTFAVRRHLLELKRKGYISWLTNSARTIQVLK